MIKVGRGVLKLIHKLPHGITAMVSEILINFSLLNIAEANCLLARKELRNFALLN
jgi:hypothetical protein